MNCSIVYNSAAAQVLIDKNPSIRTVVNKVRHWLHLAFSLHAASTLVCSP